MEQDLGLIKFKSPFITLEEYTAKQNEYFGDFYAGHVLRKVENNLEEKPYYDNWGLYSSNG
ncbi:hypothetical protein IJ579_02745 [bacterium]|nr:hypothetical protein [bacterium]